MPIQALRNAESTPAIIIIFHIPHIQFPSSNAKKNSKQHYSSDNKESCGRPGLECVRRPTNKIPARQCPDWGPRAAPVSYSRHCPLLPPSVWWVEDPSHPGPGLFPTGPAERTQPHLPALSQGHQRSKVGHPRDLGLGWQSLTLALNLTRDVQVGKASHFLPRACRNTGGSGYRETKKNRLPLQKQAEMRSHSTLER